LKTKPRYEYGRIGKLARSLGDAGVPAHVVAEIMRDGDAVRRTTSPEKKACWMGDAMRRMDRLLDERTRRAVREACACCLGGKRQEISRGIGKRGGALADRIEAANKAKLVFGHSVELMPDGKVKVSFSPEGMPGYRCPCLPKAAEPLPITYCYCCGGHVKHHLQNVLGSKVECEVLSSALSSGGKKPCTFLLELVG
jgi:hypothetical protein